MAYRIAVIALVGVTLFLGCATGSAPAPVDRSAPGWAVREGQALWKPSDDQPEIAGDVVLSTHPSGGSFIQFSKTLPIVSGRISPQGWEFENSAENKRYGGGGQPPNRLAWLQLLRVIEGQAVADRWTVAHPSKNFISLEDQHRGERLQIQFQERSQPN